MGVLLRLRDRTVADRLADVAIGGRENPYMLRWWVIPRNRFFNIYLHCFKRSDDDRARHCHPWFNLSILLEGCYVEDTPRGRFMRRAGQWAVRSPWARHRVELCGQDCWTLFVTGPKLRDWGFTCIGKDGTSRFVPWQEFTAPHDASLIGRGCGED